LPLALVAVQVEPASCVMQSEACEQTTNEEPHEDAQTVPVNIVGSFHVAPPQPISGVEFEMLPVPQQSVPALLPAQSTGPLHCQLVSPAAHAAAFAAQVDGVFADSGVSQQVWPAVQ
jgi:hypothetical protein